LVERVASHLATAAPGLFARPYFQSPLNSFLRPRVDAAILWMHAMLCERSRCFACRAAGKKKQPVCTNPVCDVSLVDGYAVRGLDDLKNHRDAICHPLTHHLDRKGVVQFVDERRDTHDLRAALVWEIHRSLNEALTAAGDPHSDLDISIRGDVTYQLDALLRPCWKPGVSPASEQALKEWLEETWLKDRVAFEKYPDGQFPRATQEERKAAWHARVKEWEESR
jgi:hypothetical protein